MTQILGRTQAYKFFRIRYFRDNIREDSVMNIADVTQELSAHLHYDENDDTNSISQLTEDLNSTLRYSKPPLREKISNVPTVLLLRFPNQ